MFSKNFRNSYIIRRNKAIYIRDVRLLRVLRAIDYNAKHAKKKTNRYRDNQKSAMAQHFAL